jgi:prepilin-type N-terminal cleavage/methylation domain-containing protein
VKRQDGFTLVELLVVMAIIATLVGIGVVGLPTLLRQGPKKAAQTFIATLSAQLEAYKSHEGAYPPTTLAEYAGSGGLPNQENLGIESVVVCLNSNRYSGSFDFAETPGCKLENYDQDQTAAQLTRFGTREMFEAVDPWNMPYVYFNAQDYARADDVGKVTGDAGPVKCQPWKNPKLKRAYRYDSFQIISAGPDREFNTGDDITNFERE